MEKTSNFWVLPADNYSRERVAGVTMSKIEIAKNLVLEGLTVKNAYFEDGDNNGSVGETETLVIEFANASISIKGADLLKKNKGQAGPEPSQVKNLSYYFKNILHALKQENRCKIMDTAGGVWEVYDGKGIKKEWWMDYEDAQTHVEILAEAGRCTFDPVANKEGAQKICATMYTGGSVWKLFLNGNYLDWYWDFTDAEMRARILKDAGQCDKITSR